MRAALEELGKDHMSGLDPELIPLIKTVSATRP
jgi:hypothetical protein